MKGAACLTSNRFSVLELCNDPTAKNMMSSSAAVTHENKETEAPALLSNAEDPPPFILVRSFGPRRRSTKLKLQLETVDSHRPLDAEGLLDTGATGLFIDEPYVDEMKFTCHMLPRAIPVYNIDGSLNENGAAKDRKSVV